MKIWAFLKDNEKQLKIIFSLFAGVYVIFEYRSSLWTDKIERTVEYIQKYNEGDILEMNVYRTRYLIEHKKDLREFIDSGGKSSDFALKIIDSDKKFFESVLVTYNFFRGVAICANIDLCEVEKTCSFFALDMWKFKYNYQAYFDDYAKDWKENALLEIDNFLAHKSCSLKRVAN